MNSYYKGLFAEYVACIILFLKGYKIITRRYKTKFGEVDIIAKKRKSIIGIEVKFRQEKTITTEYVSNKQISRIKNSLNFFISKNEKYIDFNINVEIIIFANYFKYKHFKNLEL